MKLLQRAMFVLAALLLLADSAPAEKIKVLLVGGRGHDWKGFHDVIAPRLEKTGDFSVTLTAKLDDLNAENLKQYQVVLFYGSGGEFTPQQDKALWDYARAGGAVAGVHATDAFRNSDHYWLLLGGRFTTHGGGKFWMRIEDSKHPITSGMKDFEIVDETYQNQNHPQAKMHSLAHIDRGQEQQSMVWVQQVGKARVFNTTLGHGKEAFDNPQFQQLVVRGLYWAAGREPK